MTITLDFDSEINQKAAAVFIAQLVREGMTFEAKVVDELLFITMTGGF